MDEATGRIGRYATRRVLGSGAFATVWLGRDEELDVPIAIKVLADNWARNADVRARFVDEARLLRRISDPRVVGVHDIGSLPDGRSYFVMDFADGGTVANLVGGLDRRAALELSIEVARAVQVLHDQQILHRDVKPSNLLLRRRDSCPDQLMVADLGTAKALAEASGLTMSAGTPAYMAPEQAHGDQPLTLRADVYGIAAVSFALLTGRTPFPDERGITDVALRDRSRRPALVDGGGPLDVLLADALAFDPARRPSSALELVDRLAEIAVELRGPLDQDTLAVRRRPAPHAGSPTQTPGSPQTPTPTRQQAEPEPAPDRVPVGNPARSGLTSAGLIAVVALVFVVSALLVWILLGAFSG